jgi:N6-adenosine-specific RNA methylase IME4
MDNKIIVDPEFKSLIPPLSSDEFEQLRLNLLQDGCRDAICVWGEDGGIIIDGHNRFEICSKYNLTYLVKHFQFNDREEAKEWIILNQFGRRNLSAYQRSVLALQLEGLFREKAKENQSEAGKLKQKSAEAPIETRKELAKIAGVSHDTISKVKKIQEKAPEDVKAKLASGTISINEAFLDIKKDEKIEQRKAQIEEVKKKIETENLAVEGLFDVIVIDPPWAYGREYDPQSSRVANPYPEMQVSEIEKIELPIKENSVVFLWTTHAFINDAFYLLNKWNLNYKAIIVWDKEQMGMGSTIRMQCEFCLLALKGKPIIQGSSERDIIREARREHSRKPEAFYQMVQRMTIGRKLDYFSRSKRDGWEVYGAETEKF